MIQKKKKKNSWNTVFFFLYNTSGNIFTHIGQYFGELGPKKTQKGAILWIMNRY